MITVEKLEKGTYFDDAFKISFRYDPTTVAKVKELAERRYLPEDRAWEIPAHELPALIEKVGLSNIKSEEAVVQALNTKEIEDKREATQERLKGIKPMASPAFVSPVYSLQSSSSSPHAVIPHSSVPQNCLCLQLYR